MAGSGLENRSSGNAKGSVPLPSATIGRLAEWQGSGLLSRRNRKVAHVRSMQRPPFCEYRHDMQAMSGLWFLTENEKWR